MLRAAGGRAVQVQDRRVAGTEGHALVDGGQEARVPVLRARARLAVAVVQHHVRRQVRIGRAQRVHHPGAQRRAARIEVAGVELQDRDVVGRAHRHAGLDERDLVGVLGQVGQQVREIGAALAVLPEGAAGRREQLADTPLGTRLDALEERGRDVLACELVQRRLVVVQVQRAGRAVLMQPDDRLHLGLEMRLARGERVGQLGGHGRLQADAGQQPGEGRAARIGTGLGEEIAT